MGIVKFIVGGILPYVALVVFLGGMTWRIRTWKKLPSPPMTLFPAPPT
jgi:nitrate reductase gamma subunit